jgi:hypothetical protein
VVDRLRSELGADQGVTLWPRCGLQVVSGHVHAYERTFPM